MQYSGNKVIDKKEFNREWEQYILGFEEDYSYVDGYTYNSSDRDLEALMYGCDISSSKLNQADKIRIKRYRRDAGKR